MNEPTISFGPGATRIAWPRSLIIPIAITLTLLTFFTTLELPMYIHGPGVPRGTSWAVLVAYAITVVVWLAVETRSHSYATTSVEQPAKWFRQHMRRFPVFLVGFITLNYSLRMIGFKIVGFDYLQNLGGALGLITIYEPIKSALLYCCWLGLAFGVLSFVTVRRQNEFLLATQKTLVEAKLMQLKGQLRPHFLFNTLNTISSLMQIDVVRADRMVTQLGDLLRANLDVSDRDVVPLAEELELLRQYAGIMQERFIGRVTVHWAIAADVAQACVPTMLLQPLMENAFKHGIEKSSNAETVRVRASREGDRLLISIHNSGSRILGGYKEGWGVRNSRERLQLLFTTEASLLLSNEGDGVMAQVSLPWTTSP